MGSFACFFTTEGFIYVLEATDIASHLVADHHWLTMANQAKIVVDKRSFGSDPLGGYLGGCTERIFTLIKSK